MSVDTHTNKARSQSALFVQIVCIEDKISGLKGRYGGYVSGSIVVLMIG
eukprot:COSAG01_NODE_73474_length_244_cov_17.937931_1_plen_48_part_10